MRQIDADKLKIHIIQADEREEIIEMDDVLELIDYVYLSHIR